MRGKMAGRFKLEFLDLPDSDPVWFDTREDLDSTVELLRGCPIDDGPVRLRITEYAEHKVETETV
jgi:hypothetical protein